MTDYLSKFKELKDKEKNPRREYRKHSKLYLETKPVKDDYLLNEADRVINSEQNTTNSLADFAHLSGMANELMKRGSFGNNLYFSIQGAKLYDKIGKANRNSVQRRLFNVYKTLKDKKENIPSKYEKELEKIFSLEPPKSSLEHKFIPVIAGASIIGALFFLSPNLTGNIIGNLTKNNSNIMGLVLFVLGLIGFLFYFRKK